ncbi:hypothetical protein [Microbacterium lacus]|uniref:hypothetical protein n=1 Tax=Microbacterium lacus TaxID=415217 RepID=UPI000C2CB7AB|nr:hypothetical protein [Microbacterium lacus]
MATLPDVAANTAPAHYAGDLEALGLTTPFVTGKLNEVVDLISVRWGSIVEERLRTGKLPTRLYKAVVWRVASRVFENVEGLKKETEGAYGYERSAAVASGTLWFTEDDERDLTGTVQLKKSGGRIGTATLHPHRPGFLA